LELPPRRKGHVDLGAVEIEVLQGIERTVSAAEIVEPDLVAPLVETSHMLANERLVGHQGRFGNLYMDVFVRHPVACEYAVDSFVDAVNLQVVA
jgi:hypothetical protein